jgi:hypothetical protein
MPATKLLTAPLKRLPPAMLAMKKATSLRIARLAPLAAVDSPAVPVQRLATVATSPVTSHVTVPRMAAFKAPSATSAVRLDISPATALQVVHPVLQVVVTKAAVVVMAEPVALVVALAVVQALAVVNHARLSATLAVATGT